MDSFQKRILIFRLSAIGDVVLSLPVANAIKENYPNARIGWVVENAGAQLLRNQESIDDLFVLKKSTFKSPRELVRLVLSLRQWKPGIAIDLQGLTKSSALAFLSGASMRIGFSKGDFDGRELSTFLNNRLVTPKSKHMILRGLESLAPIGIETDQFEFRMPELVSDSDFAAQFHQRLMQGAPFAIINVGAGWVSKIWPSERYADVVKYLHSEHGLRSLILWSGPSEEAAAREISKLTMASASVVAPPTSLTQLRSLIRLSSLFVGSDTGPMHLSTAVGTPTIGLIGPMPLERVGPLGSQHRGVQRERLPDNEKSNRKVDHRPMLSIQSEDVFKAIDDLLGRVKPLT